MHILAARLTMFLDQAGRSWGNAPSLDLMVDHLPDYDGPFQFRFRRSDKGGLFFAERDGVYVTYFHDGTTNDNGGLGSRKVSLEMYDGTICTIQGPWIGNPKSATKEFGLPPLVDVSLFPGSWQAAGRFNYWITYDLASECLKLVRPVDGLGSEMYRAVLVTGNNGSAGAQDYAFAIIKTFCDQLPKHLEAKY